MVVKIKAVNGPESVPEGWAEQGKAGGGTNESEAGQVQSKALSTGAFADDDVQGKVF